MQILHIYSAFRCLLPSLFLSVWLSFSCFSCSFFFSTLRPAPSFLFFFFNDTATTEIYTLSLHDALPIFQKFKRPSWRIASDHTVCGTILRPQVALNCSENIGVIIHTQQNWFRHNQSTVSDRKSTRLNSSHQIISYAVFCLKKKNKNNRKE